MLSSMGNGQLLGQINTNNISIDLSIKEKKQNKKGKIIVLQNLTRFGLHIVIKDFL